MLNFELVNLVDVLQSFPAHLLHVLFNALMMETAPRENSAATMGVAILADLQNQTVCQMYILRQTATSPAGINALVNKPAIIILVCRSPLI